MKLLTECLKKFLITVVIQGRIPNPIKRLKWKTFAKIVNGFITLINSTKVLYFACVTGFCIRLCWRKQLDSLKFCMVNFQATIF